MTSNRFNHSKIYKIVSLVDDYYYVGSTTESLSTRLSKHRSSARYNQNHEGRHNSRGANHFNSIDWNVRIILLEEVCCNNIEQLRSKENKYILAFKNDPNCLNVYDAVKNIDKKKEREKQYELIEKQKEHKRMYYKENAEKIKEKVRERNKRNQEKIICQCGITYGVLNKSKHLKTKKHLSWLSFNASS